MFKRCLIVILLAPALLARNRNITKTLKPGINYVKSPNYPKNYPAGSSFRYKFIAPSDQRIRARCGIRFPSKKGHCTTDNFWVDREGDLLMRSAKRFCGARSVLRESHFRELVFGYKSNGTRGGKFKCALIATPRSCRCGWSTPVTRRIVNGNKVEVAEFPSMVALRDVTNPFMLSFCGGTIVAHRYILTASHCLGHIDKPNDIAAVAGINNLEYPEESKYYAEYRIQQTFVHRTFDIAVLVTVKDILWNHGVGPACLLPAGTSNKFVYEIVDVLGFGTSIFGGPLTDGLQKIKQMVVSNEVCQKEYEGYSTILNSQMCTYDYTGNHRDSCQFDSGGPVYLTRTLQILIGIISRGKSCAESGYAMGVNTRISFVSSWIYQKVRKTHCVIAV